MAVRFILLLVSLVQSLSLASDFYLNPQGNDQNPGTQAEPWRSTARANLHDFQPGDRLLLEGGAAFAGPLQLGGKDSGAPGRPVVIESHGAARATIDGANGPAIVVDGAHDVVIRNLNLRGSGRKNGNTASGLLFARGANLQADHVDVAGFQKSGIEIDGVNGARLTNIRAHENGFAGISSGRTVSRDLYVGYSLAENNPGDPTIRKNHSGNGIVIGYAHGATIEHCEARYNGWDMPWTGNGPVGIWTYESDRVLIQFNVAHHNRSTANDGGGFDLDGGVTNSVVQYNYSHDNFGTGYLICQYAGAGRFADNVVRYNISQDDGLFAHDAGIFVWVGGAEMKSTLVHNNTIFNTKGAAVAFDGDKKFAEPAPVFRFFNNIFVSQGPQIRGSSKGIFQGNLYWSVGERGFRVDDYRSLEQWANATGQEKRDGRIVGFFADPLLRKDGAGLITDPGQLATLHEYRLLPASPAIDAALDLRTLFGIDPGSRDFYGEAIPSGRAFDIGACEVARRSP
jgi:hypothetical protein